MTSKIRQCAVFLYVELKLRNYVSCVSGCEIFKNCSWVCSYTQECSLGVQRFVFSRCDVEQSLFVFFLQLVCKIEIFVSFVDGRKTLKTNFLEWSYM